MIELLIQIVLLIVGFAILIKGSDIFVSGSSNIATILKIPTLIVGLTIVAFGTSAPEAAVSISSSIQGSNALAVSNVIGSNIFNILFVIGTTALICTVPFDPKFLIDSGVAVFSGILLWVGTFRHKELRRSCGIVMLLCYAAYFAYLCM